ncbi:GntR family transcriptional regulator [Oleiagrimonas sp. MCCC 1A03011]|jgi:GntR family transcriptional regulator|uniref:GntR family transcriptional regulator n=1 Tax=Oleiagrimonas sp. MCCC 1A03011 TaxID=1926883 RepID=UPI000DC2013E|nr:GntR family transcriptional regulator [Oleiagrimonas sp. MCCC 1A03011]RAP57116.1 GntR family transcriptional regulator [Oleiagrimonas sp. MCCC 1A03011]
MDASILSIQPTSPEPIYRQIVEQLRRLIAGGQLTPGEKLPSVREVAGFHAVNPMTVSRAYGLAESEGLLERQRGRGMVVATGQGISRSEDERMQLLEPHLHETARQARELELPADEVLRRLQRLLGE